MVFSQARQRSSIPSNPDPKEIYEWHAAIVKSLVDRNEETARVAIVRRYGNIQKLLDEMRIQRNEQDVATPK